MKNIRPQASIVMAENSTSMQIPRLMVSKHDSAGERGSGAATT
jgi:hypothetical protein